MIYYMVCCIYTTGLAITFGKNFRLNIAFVSTVAYLWLQLTCGICTACSSVVTSCVVNPFSGGVAPTEQCKPLDHWQTWVYIAANRLRNALTVMPLH